MTTIGDIYRFLCAVAPPALAEEWDNVGLLVGGEAAPVTSALIALDITPEVADEAVEGSAQLVVSHHPVIFHPLRAVPEGSAVWRLVRGGVAAVCMHTNLDVCEGGVNDALADALGLSHRTLLKEEGRLPYRKIAVFVPENHAAAVREAMTAAGAGLYGRYDHCTFETQGTGRFRPLPGAAPYLGSVGRIEEVREIRLEAVCAEKDVPAVISALRRAHPYEEPAYDIFPDEALGTPYGLGRVGDLPEALPLREFARAAGKALGCAAVSLCDAGRVAHRVAVCGGADDGTLAEAARRAGADTLLVGEMKHSNRIEALNMGVNVVAAGHFATENPVCPHLRALLSERFPAVRFAVARTNRAPSQAVACGADSTENEL